MRGGKRFSSLVLDVLVTADLVSLSLGVDTLL